MKDWFYRHIEFIVLASILLLWFVCDILDKFSPT